MTSTEFTVGATDRASKVLGFDANGELTVTQELGTNRGNWSSGTDYSARDIVKDTSTNNIFLVNTAHTSTGSQPLTTNANSAKYDLLVDAVSQQQLLKLLQLPVLQPQLHQKQMQLTQQLPQQTLQHLHHLLQRQQRQKPVKHQLLQQVQKMLRMQLKRH